MRISCNSGAAVMICLSGVNCCCGSYQLHLLIGLGYVEVDHGGRLSAMGGTGPRVVAEGDPASDAGTGL
jgi:hypothetical protein